MKWPGTIEEGRLTFTDTGLFVDLRTSDRKLYPDRWSTSSTNRGKASVNEGRWRIPRLGDGNVTSTTIKSLSFRFGGSHRNGVCINEYIV